MSPPVAVALAAVAAGLRRVTVEVRGQDETLGSGVVWSRAGLVVTSDHVVRGRWCTVVTADGRRAAAEVARRDPVRDLALLHLDRDDLEAAEPGDSDRIRPGELVIAAGSPLGVSGAVTAGVLHGIDRAAGWLTSSIRLAPGNSGGPLADARGRVIGINARVSAGLALAIPTGVVHRFVDSAVRRRPPGRP